MPLEQVIKSLEDVIAKSPLSKMWAGHSSEEGGAIVSTSLFAKREDMEKAKTLKTALNNNLIKLEQYEDEFPQVPYIAVEVMYNFAEVRVAGEGTRLSLMQDAVLPDLSMLLCRGLSYSYIADDEKNGGEVLFKVNFSEDGTVYEVKNSGLIEPPLITVGASAVEAFKALEHYVMAAEHSQL